jgi:hypothetical protein
MQALERAVRDFVLGSDVPPGDAAAVADWLERNGVSEKDAEALRTEATRLSVYRTLVRKRLSDAVELAVPRTRARLGPLFDEHFDRFLLERGPRSHYLRDVTTEFLDFLEPRAPSDPRLPPWTLDLARHEALDVLVGSLAEPPATGGTLELDSDRGLVFSVTARVVRYGHAVHRLSSDPDDRNAPERVPVALFVYRSPKNEVRYLELTALAARILEALLAGETLRDSLARAGRELDVPLDEAVLEGTARLLSDLAERGAVLGAKAVKAKALDLQNAVEPAEDGVSPALPQRPRTA